MKIEVDTHTHCIASIHAYSTINELALGAKAAKLKGFVLTDHGPALQNGQPHPHYFSNLRVLPPKINGVHVFHGVELNILDTNGCVDLSPKCLKSLDFVMAGLHIGCFDPGTPEVNTKALIAAIENPLVDAISHPGNGSFPVNLEQIVDAAKKRGKILEINNSSFKVRRGSNENCRELARLCKENGNLISVASDAHYFTYVGVLETALSVVNEAMIDPNHVINHKLAGFIEYITRRKADRGNVII
ncbi:phosphatase [Spirochaetia bacterium]|nr:phosphatase [Spirochaetia bacterium]